MAEELKGIDYSSTERSLLVQIGRFLVHVADHKIAQKAAKAGYDSEEHSIGWRLYNVASGANVPLETLVSQATHQMLTSTDTVRLAIRELDTFENLWFPRVTATLKRFIAPEHKEAFLNAFFDRLTQQPEGPGVINSVSTFVDRVEALVQSQVPGAKEARRALAKRGLSAESIRHVRKLLDSARATPAQACDGEAERTDSLRKRREAFDELKLWYRDWATSLRDELGYHDQLRLGLRKNKGGHGASVDDAEETEDDEDVG